MMSATIIVQQNILILVCKTNLKKHETHLTKLRPAIAARLNRQPDEKQKYHSYPEINGCTTSYTTYSRTQRVIKFGNLEFT